MKTGTLDRGFLTLEPVGVITNPSSMPGPLSKLGIGTCLRIFKFSLSPWSNSQFFFLPKYLLILSLTFNFLRLALANLIPHVIYCKNHHLFSLQNSCLSSSESTDGRPSLLVKFRSSPWLKVPFMAWPLLFLFKPYLLLLSSYICPLVTPDYVLYPLQQGCSNYSAFSWQPLPLPPLPSL